MPDSKPTDPTPPAPPPAPAADWRVRYAPLLWWAAQRLALLILGALAAWLGIRPATVEKIIQVPVPAVDEFDHGQGWVRDPEALEQNADPEKTLQFRATPAGQAVLGDGDVFLWRGVRKAANKPAPWFPNIDQKSVGCCVGCTFKHGADVCLAIQVAEGRSGEWVPFSAEAIYGFSRVDVGGGRIRGDGSVGSWAAKAAKDIGYAPMRKYASADLSEFSPARAREFGRSGVPADVKAAARNHPVKGAAIVTSWADVKRAVAQGYPVAVCSDVGFDNRDGTVGTRDANGFIGPRGTWMHAMTVIGTRGGTRPGGFILNSWGDAAHRGPVWPEDAPKAGFWADAEVIDRMVRQGDSFALSDLQGFPKRVLPLDWFIHAAPKRERDPFALLVKPEASLSW